MHEVATEMTENSVILMSVIYIVLPTTGSVSIFQAQYPYLQLYFNIIVIPDIQRTVLTCTLASLGGIRALYFHSLVVQPTPSRQGNPLVVVAHCPGVS